MSEEDSSKGTLVSTALAKACSRSKASFEEISTSIGSLPFFKLSLICFSSVEVTEPSVSLSDSRLARKSSTLSDVSFFDLICFVSSDES